MITKQVIVNIDDESCVGALSITAVGGSWNAVTVHNLVILAEDRITNVYVEKDGRVVKGESEEDL